MNTNYYLIKVIQNEKMEEIRDMSEKASLIKLISKKGTETKIYRSLFIEKLVLFQAWLILGFKFLRLSSR